MMSAARTLLWSIICYTLRSGHTQDDKEVSAARYGDPGLLPPTIASRRVERGAVQSCHFI
jgi:hypothetical protein